MSSMIERVARRIGTELEKRGVIINFADEIAKAALAEMEEPTQAMAYAPQNAGAVVLTMEGHQPLYPGNARQAWVLMIREALKEPT